jgi:hypothetical protein
MTVTAQAAYSLLQVVASACEGPGTMTEQAVSIGRPPSVTWGIVSERGLRHGRLGLATPAAKRQDQCPVSAGGYREGGPSAPGWARPYCSVRTSLRLPGRHATAWRRLALGGFPGLFGSVASVLAADLPACKGDRPGSMGKEFDAVLRSDGAGPDEGRRR